MFSRSNAFDQTIAYHQVPNISHQLIAVAPLIAQISLLVMARFVGIMIDLLCCSMNVTKSYLPPLADYVRQLEQVWRSGWLTNNGSLVSELEARLKEYLGVKHLLFTSNGTIALQLALKALDIKGEVITTPFSYVATTTSILWENCAPVFVDIDPSNFCIDPERIESAITEHTHAIMPVHVYGLPCAVERIESIARKYDLKVIYDAAHAFGTRVDGKSIAQFGDISTFSFHATKIFHTVEGGAVATDDDELARKLFLFRSFGHVGDDYYTIGINAKNSEFHAAMGLCNFPMIEKFIDKRRSLVNEYDARLRNVPLLKRPVLPPQTEYNFSYYPIVFPSEILLLRVKERLEDNGINTRRYFCPSLNTLPYVNGDACPYAESLASRVLCLPLFYELEIHEVRAIAQLVRAEVLSAVASGAYVATAIE